MRTISCGLELLMEIIDRIDPIYVLILLHTLLHDLFRHLKLSLFNLLD